jgi:hypothetical protein
MVIEGKGTDPRYGCPFFVVGLACIFVKNFNIACGRSQNMGV